MSRSARLPGRWLWALVLVWPVWEGWRGRWRILLVMTWKMAGGWASMVCPMSYLLFAAEHLSPWDMRHERAEPRGSEAARHRFATTMYLFYHVPGDDARGRLSNSISRSNMLSNMHSRTTRRRFVLVRSFNSIVRPRNKVCPLLLLMTYAVSGSAASNG